MIQSITLYVILFFLSYLQLRFVICILNEELSWVDQSINQSWSWWRAVCQFKKQITGVGTVWELWLAVASIVIEFPFEQRKMDAQWLKRHSQFANFWMKFQILTVWRRQIAALYFVNADKAYAYLLCNCNTRKCAAVKCLIGTRAKC